MTLAIRFCTQSVLGSACPGVVERQHLPEGPAVDFYNEPLETRHAYYQRLEG
jgi:hypothetical protein